MSVATIPRRAGRTGPGRCFGGWTFCCRFGFGGRLLGAFPSWAGRWGVWARAWGRRIRNRTAAATRCCRLRGRRPSRRYWRSTSRHPPDKCNNTPQHYLLPASATAISGTLPYSFLNLSGVSLAQAARAESPIEPPMGQGEPDISMASQTRMSAHSMATAATFKPWLDSSRASLMRSQLESVMVAPPADNRGTDGPRDRHRADVRPHSRDHRSHGRRWGLPFVVDRRVLRMNQHRSQQEQGKTFHVLRGAVCSHVADNDEVAR